MRRRTAFLLAVPVLAAIGIFFAGKSVSEPSEDGHPLSYWIREYWLEGPDAERGLRGFGTNAFPYLLRWMRAETPRYKLVWYELTARVHLSVAPRGDDTPRPLLSAHAFKALRNEAAAVVPEIAQMARDTNHPGTADMALTALSYMGVPGAQSLLAAACDPSHPYRWRAIYMVGESSDLGPLRDSAVTNLISALSDPRVNQDAGMALGRLKTRPDIIVPALAKCLEGTTTAPNFRAIAATSLICFNEQSAPALPYLTNALNDPDPEVRRQAANSIDHINNSIFKSTHPR